MTAEIKNEIVPVTIETGSDGGQAGDCERKQIEINK